MGPGCTSSLQEFIQSLTPVDSVDSDCEIDLEPFLNSITDLSVIEYSILVLQLYGFIAG